MAEEFDFLADLLGDGGSEPPAPAANIAAALPLVARREGPEGGKEKAKVPGLGHWRNLTPDQRALRGQH